MQTRHQAGFFMPKHRLDEMTLAVFGDDDSGFGRTYADDDDSADDFDLDDTDGLDREWLEIMTGRSR